MTFAFFVDTSYLVALLNSKDQDHLRARTYARSLPLSSDLIITNYIVFEFLNYFSERGEDSRRSAIRFVRQLENDPRVRILHLSMDTYYRGIERYERSTDKGWSFTDSTSFLIMEDMRLTNALTFDRHFVQAGFVTPFH